jgi:serine/threonine protein kinase/tetratricopeptide (TPR) repeat protein
VTAREPLMVSAPLAPEWKGTARYEVIGCLGRGGMGVVYEAFDRERKEQVAVKTLLNFGAADLYLFKQEFRTLADVQHNNLVHLYELVVPEDGQVFFTMELVRGCDFRQYVERSEPRRPSSPPANVVVSLRSAADRDTMRSRSATDRDTMRPRLASSSEARSAPRRSPADMDRLRQALIQLVEGVEALHTLGKMHRDIKPSNVLVTPEGRVVLLDFGVAAEIAGRFGETAGGSGEMVGTTRYMDPEQACDGPPIPASDWYSVGVVLYEALVGRPPFVGRAVDVLAMKSTADAPPLSLFVDGVPDDLDALCRALLHRDPAMRPTASEILERLGVAGKASSPPAIAAADPSSAFIGREAQLVTLREAYDKVRSGQGITVRVAGALGMGKSTTVHRFLDELTKNGEALVLHGRAYERESVPFKVVDSVIDALSRQLMRFAGSDTPLPPPAGAWALGRLFPVLKRVAGFEPPAEETREDPQGVRRLAFGALRELLHSLAQRQPLVVFVDDVHWGDVDSANLLLDLLRPPNAPPLLLVMTFRDDEAKTSPFLVEVRERWPATAETRDVTVGPLEAEDAHRLAIAQLDANDDMAQRTARAVARESRGSPFLIEELVRNNRGVASATGTTLAVLTLEQMVSERLDRLPAQARQLIEILAVGARPLPVSVAASASGVEAGFHEVMSVLAARRFARTGLRDGREVVETTHDRIRETIVASLPAQAIRDHHRRLARVLEEVPGADAEAVAMHWLGAGDLKRASRFAEGAAEQATAKLAFDQAARLYRLAIESSPTASNDVRRMRPRYAEALQLAGRFDESARAYLEAARGAQAGDKVEFQRAAAQQMLSAGRLDDGAKILRRVLSAVRMSAPRSPIGAAFWLVVYRVWLAALGLRFKERAPEEVSREDRLRIEALYTVAMGFSIVNVVLGACMQTRHLIEALRRGDRFQVMRAASLTAAHLASTGKRPGRLEGALLEIARGLAERDGSREATTHFAGAWGVGLFLRGRWKEARELLERGYKVALYSNAGFANIRLFAIYSGFFLGDIQESSARLQRLFADAEHRKDRYTTVNLGTSVCIHAYLAADDPACARRRVERALRQWPRTDFHVQHWQAMVYSPDIDLYEGHLEGVYERFMEQMPALRKSLLLHAGYIRSYTRYANARFAIASIEALPELRLVRVREALRLADQLEHEHDSWTLGLAALVRGCAENAAGNRDGAIAALRSAVERTEATGTLALAAAARFRLGQLLRGDDGGVLVKSATEAMLAQGVRVPERWAAIHAPGSWGQAPEPK